MKEKRKFVILECVTTASNISIKKNFKGKTHNVFNHITQEWHELYIKQVDVNEAQDLTGKK
jgi:hypothetical protein